MLRHTRTQVPEDTLTLQGNRLIQVAKSPLRPRPLTPVAKLRAGLNNDRPINIRRAAAPST